MWYAKGDCIIGNKAYKAGDILPAEVVALVPSHEIGVFLAAKQVEDPIEAVLVDSPTPGGHDLATLMEQESALWVMPDDQET